jgi:hypothetical protein
MHAQQQNTGASVPQLVKFSGTLKDHMGKPLKGMLGITFAIYIEQVGGAPLWMETQNVEPGEQGAYTVLLGATQAEGLPLELFVTGEARWLGVHINLPDEVEQPRILLVSVPYALKAADADTLGGKAPAEYVLSSSLQNAVRREIQETAGASTFTAPITSLQVTGTGTPGRVAKFTTSTEVGDSQIFDTGTNVGVGTTNPVNRFHVNGLLRVGDSTTTALATDPLLTGIRIGVTGGSEAAGLEMFTSSYGSGYGWLINAPDRWNGNTPLSFKFRSNASVWSELMTLRSDTQAVGIRTQAPVAPLHVNGVGRFGNEVTSGTASTPLETGIVIGVTGGSETAGVELFTSSYGAGYGWLINAPDRFNGDTPLSFKFRSNSSVWSELMTLRSDTQSVGIGTTTPLAKLDVAGDVRVSGKIDAGEGNFSAVTAMTGIATSSISQIGGTPITITTGNLQVSGGLTMPSGSLSVSGTISSGSNVNVAGGLTTGGGGGITINNGALNVTSAGANNSIAGNLNVSGTLAKGSGSFKIDHPLDPAAKYLYHSFVESPDMMNIYNGVVKLDARGQAWVVLPDWFEALNQDFRYQLTAMGSPAPKLHIASEISGNRFKIAGGRPHGKVSWQVTGIRHDAFASAHRIPVEEDKPPAEQGTYLHPEVFGRTQSTTAGAPPRGRSKTPPVEAGKKQR